MKKLLSMMILALAITIGIQFTDKSKANADNLLLIRDSNYEKIYVFVLAAGSALCKYGMGRHGRLRPERRQGLSE